MIPSLVATIYTSGFVPIASILFFYAAFLTPVYRNEIFTLLEFFIQRIFQGGKLR